MPRLSVSSPHAHQTLLRRGQALCAASSHAHAVPSMLEAQRAERSAARADGNHAFSRQRTSSTARRVAARTSSHNGGLVTRAERGRQQEETRHEQRTAEAEARNSLRCGISRIDVGGAIAWRESAALVQREWPRTQRALAWGSLAQSHLPAHAAHSFDNMRPAVCSSAR